MRKILFASALSLFVAASGMAQNKDKDRGNDQETIEGNGKLVTREIPVSAFDAIKASGIYELKLSQGSKETVKIEADENLQEYFEVKNDGNKLVIDMKKLEHKNLKVHDKMKVYVTFKNVKELDLSMVGSVNSESQLTFSDLKVENKSVGNVDLKFTANKMDLQNSSVGHVKLSGKAQDAVVRNTGVGQLDAGDFVVQTMDIQNTGVGNAEVNAEKDLKVKDSFLGKVRNKGNAPVRKMNRVRV